MVQYCRFVRNCVMQRLARRIGSYNMDTSVDAIQRTQRKSFPIISGLLMISILLPFQWNTVSFVISTIPMHMFLTECIMILNKEKLTVHFHRTQPTLYLVMSHTYVPIQSHHGFIFHCQETKTLFQTISCETSLHCVT